MMPPVTSDTALFLDIDGTLLDIARTPDKVKVPRDLVQALTHLHGELSGALAFVSGRSLAGIDALFAPFRPASIGAHGAEMRRADGRIIRAAPVAAPVRAFFQDLSSRAPGLLLEDKRSALALHYRLAPEAEAMLLAAIAGADDLFAANNISIIHGKRVIEARPLGIDKGSATAAMARQKPFAGRRLLFGGDDTTDQDVFRILPRLGGRGFSVGRRFTGAQYLFTSPRAVRSWLVRLAREGVAP